MTTQMVTVILSTYNGAKYIDQFLVSLALQSRRPDCIVVRDDGSTDDTCIRVQRWAQNEGIRLHFHPDNSTRLGPAKSFLAALAECDPADIYFFADQDDIWLPGKIQRALDSVVWGEGAFPMLYVSRLAVVDKTLKFKYNTKIPRFLNFSNAVCENSLTGCTMAFNHPLAKLLNQYTPENMLMHDWWLYLLCSAFGTIYFDESPTILYRQHSNNVLGEGPSGFSLLLTRINRFLGGPTGERSGQLREFFDHYELLLDPEKRDLASRLLGCRHSLLSKIHLALQCPLTRESLLDNIGVRVSILLNRY